MTTIAIERPTAPIALPENDEDRRPERVPANKRGNGTTRYHSKKRQLAANAYFAKKQEAKLREAYPKMSPFMLKLFIERLKAEKGLGTKREQTYNKLRLEVAEWAQLKQETNDFRLPEFTDIPVDSPAKLKKRFFLYAIELIESELPTRSNQSQHKKLNARLDGFRTELKKLVANKKTS